MDDESHPRLHNGIRLVVVTTQEQLMHAFLIRSICFMEGEGLEVGQAIDGNDFQATHMVVYDGDQPVGATRIRWFRDFAKVERTAFRAAYRDPRLLKRIADQMFEHIARKGYSTVITHCELKLVPVWRRILGFKVVEHKQPLVSAEYPDCYEMIKQLNPPADAITIDTDIGTLYRIEGAWDQPTWLG